MKHTKWETFGEDDFTFSVLTVPPNEEDEVIAIAVLLTKEIADQIVADHNAQPAIAELVEAARGVMAAVPEVMNDSVQLSRFHLHRALEGLQERV